MPSNYSIGGGFYIYSTRLECGRVEHYTGVIHVEICTLVVVLLSRWLTGSDCVREDAWLRIRAGCWQLG